jgi:hypothetical protein
MKGKVPVSQRALIQRINRALAKDDRKLCKTRGGVQARIDCGEFYILETRRNLMLDKDVSPEAWGRELGVLHEYEHVV